MTQQIPNQLIYNDQTQGMVQIEGSGLFTPMDFGLECKSATTACWRGYVMRSVITDKQLILDSMWFKPKVPDIKDLPKVNDIGPELITRETNPTMGFFFTHAYKNLNKITSFSGNFGVFDETTSQLVHITFYLEDGLIVNIIRKSLGPVEPEPNSRIN